MSRWLPSLPATVLLWVLWLLLNDSIAAADVLLGGVIAVAAQMLVAPLKPRSPQVRKPLVLARLVLHVVTDVVVSALQVAAGVLRAGRRPPRGAFVAVPLEVRHPHGLACLAIITAVVPGTVWCELAADHATVLVHGFDVEDEAVFVAHFKQRYELPLKEIFG